MIPVETGRKTAAPTSHGGTKGRSGGKSGNQKQQSNLGYVDPYTGTAATPGSLGLTDTGSFVRDLASIAAQTAGIKPVNYGAYHGQASQFAGQDIAAQVNPLRTQQQDILRTGRQQAGLIGQLGQSAAAFTEPWAQQIFNSYNALSNQAYSAAQGLSGATRDAALADAQANQNMLSSIGSPQGTDPGRAQALGNVLTGLGNMGAGTLGLQAVAAQRGALGVPQQMLGYGQAQAAGTLGQATQEALKINPQIANIRATRGKLTREYQQDLFKNAQTSQEMKLKTLGMRADIVSSMGSMAQASNAQKIQLAQFNQQAVESHNAIVTAQRNYRLETRKIDQAWRIAKLTDANADADRAAQMTIAANDLEASTARANAELEVRWADTKGWYRDKQGRPVANPGNRLVIDPKTGQIRAVEEPSPAEKVSLRTLTAQRDRDRGWQWANGKRVALPGKVLVFDKKGKFLGAKRDPSQYAGAGGAGALTAGEALDATSAVADEINDWAFGKSPTKFSSSTLPGQPDTVPGWGKDPKTGQMGVIDLQAYTTAGGTLPLPYKELLTKVMLKSPWPYEVAKAYVDKIYLDRGEDPRYAQRHNTTVGDPNNTTYSALGLDPRGH